ncbi:glutamate formimidoyltransferase [Calorimonas adulescens]|uniref:glutamate formimidoyltransferase n=1 Tax=Calorimonas adulescens TaxID=2606906 RepID=A0A5D8QI29_9THEO|nr:glutamate formimidoyltransferase [Calorimonas adulescens]TZE83213.1 glutamate formimidoyltransferase [Calorimonas adulescens]
MRLVGCVPNFSEGRNKTKINSIVEEIKKIDGVKLIDVSTDYNHNRTVVTFLGEPEEVAVAAYNACRRAVELIDMSKHTGEHPRMGAVDVVPFVPVKDVTMEECIELAEELGRKIGGELHIPVYLYEAAATKPEREDLAYIRKGQYEGFFDKIKQPGWEPDFGPREVNIKSGVTAVGARPPLIAFNVNLNTQNLDIAKNIARAVRNSSGGFRYVKAVGVNLEDKKMVQVSMNMTDYKKTPLHRVYELIKAEASRYGVSIAETEIVGLVPSEALLETAVSYLQLHGFRNEQILENYIYE